MKQKIQTSVLSDNQLGIFYETIRTSYPVYISQTCLTFKGTFDYSLFQQAYRLIIERHEILRTAFSIKKGKINTAPVQIIYESIEPTMLYYDYMGLLPKEKNRRYKQFLDNDLIAPFDFDRPSLMRLTTIRFSKKEYRVIWTRHHILLDGASARLVLTELLTIYDALVNNRTWKLPSNSSYLAAKEKFFVRDRNQTMQYWKKQLKFFKKSSIFPAISWNSSVANFSQFGSKLPRKEYKNLLDFVSKHGLTINSVLQAAWGIVLSHYSNNKHVIFGSVRAYPKEEVENCAGLFINTLPLALTINPKIKLLDFLKSVREQGKTLREYIHTSLSDIRNWCGLALDELLYLSIIDYKPYSLNKIIKLNFSDLNCETSFRLTTPYPMVLEINNEDDHLEFRLNYSQDLFAPEFAKGILEHFRDITRELCLHSSKTLAELQTLPHLDWKKSIIEWNRTKKSYPLDKTLHQYFEEQAAKTPKANAIFYHEKSLTYATLNNKANQLAHFIISKNIKPEALIIILTIPNFNEIVSVLAVLKAGGAYVPIDVNYPLERIKNLINDSGSEIIICDNKTYQMLIRAPLESLEKSVELINLDTVSLENFSSSNLDLNISSSNLAYMIYTSGSTGKPKGVLVEHRSVLNMALGCIERLKITPESRILQIASFGFDVAVAEWSMALLSGASLCLLDKGVFNPRAIVDALESHRITTIILASSILTALPHRNIPNLKVIAVGGEPCSDAVINYWAKDRLFLNVYGITETTVCSTIANCYPEQTKLSIGVPLPNTQTYILNENKQPLPIGVYGEIYVGGIGVARGYWNQVDLTREKFIKNPFIEQLATDHSLQINRIYRTGDKGRWLPNGELEFLGRVDEQVKLMGVRIELLEVEKVIEQHPDVEKAAVILTPDNKQLQAFVLGNGKRLDLDKLRQFLRTILPHGLIPRQFIAVKRFPLTSNGKINKEELVDCTPIKIASVEMEEGQFTNTEKIILSKVRKIMGLKNVPINQNFLDIGLKSIDLVVLSVELSDHLKQEVSVVNLFNYPTIKALAHYLDRLTIYYVEEKLILKKHSLNPRYQKRQRVNFNDDD